MKLYDLEQYIIIGKSKGTLKIKNQQQSPTVLKGKVTERDVISVLGVDYAEKFMKGYPKLPSTRQLLTHGFMEGLIKNQVVCTEPFLMFERGEKIQITINPKMSGVTFHSSRYGGDILEYCANFKTKPGIDLSQTIRKALLSAVYRYRYDLSYFERDATMRALKVVMTNNIGVEALGEYDGHRLGDMKRDWLIPSLDPLSYLTYGEVEDIFNNNLLMNAVKDVDGKRYVGVESLKMGTLYLKETLCHYEVIQYH